ncbi:sensor histidine kinase [Spirosoma validum]|uniref:Histidine kinase n=1 Tax=Spirosoma validum TaxID=2771355 RepID=A0A927GBY1_9BACT|nr:histidine kinase [Spirosoma validum]MBD2752078.1 histidine kinase [Spirosoma validum]
MNITLETSEYKSTSLSAPAAWLKEVARPFVIRWWMWIILVISPAYMIWFFTKSSLEDRVNRNIERFNEASSVSKVGPKTNSDSSYRVGYALGKLTLIATGNPLFLLATSLLLIALLQLQYRYLFQVLFERDALGQRVYWLLMIGIWLMLEVLLAVWIGKKGSQQGYQWTLANSFVLLNIGYSLLMSWGKSRRRQLTLIQQRTQAELDALKAQVNPHFLFNSLNNIYGTALLEDSPRTAESIQQLSGIVRYVMEESRLQTTNIQRELRFIDDFVELQRIRLPNQDNIDISTTIEWDEKPAQIVPLLLNPLIENAFKYGISIQYPCFVRIRLQVQKGTLKLITENSILPRTDLEKGTGLGLANVRQRLALAYPERHTLRVEENDKQFRVELTINL